jgi:hypothetical protein
VWLQVLVEQQIGTLTMGIIDLEVQRIDAKMVRGTLFRKVHKALVGQEYIMERSQAVPQRR